MQSPPSDDRSDETSSELPLIEIPCPLCGDDDPRLVTSARDYVYGVPGYYRFVRCQSCGHLYINPRPADGALMRCYPDDYAPHLAQDGSGSPELDSGAAGARAAGARAAGSPNPDPVDSAAPPPDSVDTPELVDKPGSVGTPAAEVGDGPPEDHLVVERASDDPPRSSFRRIVGRIPGLKRFLFWLGQQHATVIPRLPKSSPRRLLEIGCAHGGYLAEAADAGWMVDGIEPDPAAAERARQRGFDVSQSTLSTASIADESRQAIVAWMVLEHVPDPSDFVRQSLRILSPDGVFSVSVPNASGIERWLFGRRWLGYDAPRHLQVFSASRLRKLLADTGFVDIRVIHQSSMRYWWGSLAAVGMDCWPNAKWPRRWMDYFIHEPPGWMRLMLLVPEKLLSAFRCSGRITVIARKPSNAL